MIPMKVVVCNELTYDIYFSSNISYVSPKTVPAFSCPEFPQFPPPPIIKHFCTSNSTFLRGFFFFLVNVD